MFGFDRIPKSEEEKEGKNNGEMGLDNQGNVIYENEVEENRTRSDRNPEDFESPFKEYTPDERR